MKIWLLAIAIPGLSACGQTVTSQHLADDQETQSVSSLTGDAGWQQEALVGKVGQRGLYRLVRSGGVVDSPQTSTGKGISKPVIELVRSTDRIPLIRGARMYLQYRLWPLPAQPAWVDLRRVLRHPEMVLPDGTKSTGSDYIIKRKVSSNQVIAYTGYGFDEEYELVEGVWEFEIWHGDRKLIGQKFTTYWPDRAEIDELQPVLELGNGVLGKVNTGENVSAGHSWPQVIVGNSDAGIPEGVAAAKQEMDEFLRAEQELAGNGQ